MPTTSATLDVSIRAEVLNGVWETFGVDRDVEVDPETVQYSTNEWGCEKASFVLRRSPWVAWPDLSPFTPVEIEVGGVIVWIGRTEGTPFKAGAEAQISVQAQGWQFHLDDNLYKRVYVHATMTDWKDIRSSLEADLASYASAPQVQAEAQLITLSFPQGSEVVENTTLVGAYLDLGEAAANAVHVEFGETTFAAGYYAAYVVTAASVADLTEGTKGIRYEFDPATPTTLTLVASVPDRYVGIIIARRGKTEPENGDRNLKITSITVFSEPTYESGGASVLRASTVIESALPYAPLLSTDTSQIDPYAGSGNAEVEDDFDIPSLVLATPQTPRQVCESMNSFHDWLLFVDLERRLNFRPPPTEPLLEYGAWSGEQTESPSAGEAADIYSSVLVTGTAANGEALEVTVTSADLGTSTIADQRGFTRAKTISLSNATDEATMRKIGEVWLEDQLVTPFGGAITVPVGGLRTVLGGQPVHPSLVCRHVNEPLRVAHAMDPTDGGVGRDGFVVATSYEHATQTATVSLGARLDAVEALLARLAVVAEPGS